MTLDEVEKSACGLLRQYEKDNNNKHVLEAEALFENFIANNPYNTQARIRYALFEFLGPYEDSFKAIEYLTPILQYDSQNAYALIILAYIYRISSYIPDEILSALSNLKEDNNNTMAMIEYTKALYYRHNSNQNYENHLIKSIAYCKTHVLNYYKLAKLYLRENKLQEARILIKKAIANVQCIYTDTYFDKLSEIDKNDNYNCIPSIEEFLNERIRGTYITDVNFETMQELLNKISKNCLLKD